MAKMTCLQILNAVQDNNGLPQSTAITSLSGINSTVDPNFSVNPRGNSKIEYPNVYYFSENAAWIVNDISGQYNWGYIKDTRPYQKLFGYQSYEEANYEYNSGVNKVTDSFDFFTGAALPPD